MSTADRISVTPGIEFLSQNIAPWANAAEVILDGTSSDLDFFEGEVTFTFSWENQTGQDGLFTATAVLGVTATCVVEADSYWWPLDPTPPFSELDAYADLRITYVVDGPVIEPPYQSTQSQDIMHLVVNGLWGEGNIVGQDLFRGYVLQYLDLFVPSNVRVEFDLSCYLSRLAVGGGGQFVAAHNGRQVAGFGVFIRQGPSIIQHRARVDGATG